MYNSQGRVVWQHYYNRVVMLLHHVMQHTRSDVQLIFTSIEFFCCSTRCRILHMLTIAVIEKQQPTQSHSSNAINHLPVMYGYYKETSSITSWYSYFSTLLLLSTTILKAVRPNITMIFPAFFSVPVAILFVDEESL